MGLVARGLGTRAHDSILGAATRLGISHSERAGALDTGGCAARRPRNGRCALVWALCVSALATMCGCTACAAPLLSGRTCWVLGAHAALGNAALGQLFVASWGVAASPFGAAGGHRPDPHFGGRDNRRCHAALGPLRISTASVRGVVRRCKSRAVPSPRLTGPSNGAHRSAGSVRVSAALFSPR